MARRHAPHRPLILFSLCPLTRFFPLSHCLSLSLLLGVCTFVFMQLQVCCGVHSACRRQGAAAGPHLWKGSLFAVAEARPAEFLEILLHLSPSPCRNSRITDVHGSVQTQVCTGAQRALGPWKHLPISPVSCCFLDTRGPLQAPIFLALTSHFPHGDMAAGTQGSFHPMSLGGFCGHPVRGLRLDIFLKPKVLSIFSA